MKKLKSKVAIFIAVLSLAISGCKSEDPIPVPTPGEASYIELPRNNTFQEVATSGNGNWAVTEFPEWAAPMEETGAMGKDIVLFVETNDNDEDRTATVKIKYSDGSENVYTVMQHGALSDNNNGAELSSGNLKISYGVGFSTNVFLQSDAGKYYICSDSPINFKNLKAELDAIGESDGMTDDARYCSRIETVTGSSTSAIANQLSINAGIEVGITGFKLGVDGGYKQKGNDTNTYEYAIEEIQHIVGSRQLRSGLLKYFVDNGKNIYQKSFNELRNKLADNTDNKQVMEEIIAKYGTHIITQGSVGGELKLSMQMIVDDNVKSSDIHAALEIGSKVVNASGSIDMSNRQKQISKNTEISLVTYGGENVFTVAPGTSFESFLKDVKDESKLNKWIEKFRQYNVGNNDGNASGVSLIDIEVYPIYEFMPTTESRDALRNYIVTTYQKEIYSTTQNNSYKGPDLYILKGLKAPEYNHEDECSLKIEQIDLEVVACHTKINELSADEYSTVIYSGSIGKVNRNRGFFIGSKSRKPCKFKRNHNGEFEIEVFDRLDKGALEEFYVDATGDITIFPKTASDLYQTEMFSDWKYFDVSSITGDKYTITTSKTLIGSTGATLYINDNVTVSLENVSLRGVRCNGNAKLIIEPNTFNSLVLLVPGHPGTTLTIEGSGTMDAKCGIGSSGRSIGNIVINGGKLVLTGPYGPAIGVVYDNTCGDITINGGDIIARTKHSDSPAIGASLEGKCGRIFVSSNIKSLTVNRGLRSPNAIGSGLDGTSGEVIIEDPLKVHEEQ